MNKLLDNQFILIEKNIDLIDLNNLYSEILLDELKVYMNKLRIMNDHDVRLNTQLQTKISKISFKND